MAERPIGEFSAPSMEERVNNWKLFFKGENTRKLLGFFYGSEFPAQRYHAALSLPEGRDLVPGDFCVESYLDDNERLFEEMELFPGDFIFSASAFWGIPWLEAAIGCPIRINHVTGSLYAVKPEWSGEPSVPEFEPDSPWTRKLLEFLTKAALKSGGRYPLATTRMRGIADLLSAIYGGEELIYRMIQKPEEILSVAKKLTQFYIKFTEFQLRHIPDFYGGIGSFYYHVLAPPGTVWHQEDSVMLLSPDMYRKFIFPFDAQIFRAFQGNIMHFHSIGGYIPLHEVRALKPLAVEMHIDAGGPEARELYEMHTKILEVSPLIIWGRLSEDDLEWIFTKLPNRSVAVNAVVDDLEAATAYWMRYGAGKGRNQ